MVMALVIVLIFGMSSLAFVATNTFSSSEQQQTALNNFVIDGDINQSIEYPYISKGYTFLRFYYTEDSQFISYMDQVPDAYLTSTNQKQVFVLKISANETYIKISNLNGEKEIYNLTYDKIFDGLCEQLVVTPSECGLRNLLLNQTNTTQ